MTEERRLNLVLAQLRDDSPETKQKFIDGMAQAFRLRVDQLEKILQSLPFVLSRDCTLEEARAMAEKVQGVGGVCRLQDPSQAEAPPSPPPKRAPQPEVEQAEEAPEQAAPTPRAAPSPVAVEERPDQAFDMPGPDQSAGAEDVKADIQSAAKSAPPPERPAPPKPAPAAKPATEDEPTPTIPLAIPGAGGVGSSAPVGAGKVKCIECGEVQPAGATCRSCYFPLPER